MARYRPIAVVRNKTHHFVDQVRVEEQPYKRVWDMVQNARRRRGADEAFQFDDAVIQTRAYLLANTLSLRCDLVVLSDFLSLRRQAPVTPSQGKLTVDFAFARKECEELVDMAATSNQPRQLVEGHIFFAHFAALERASAEDPDAADELQDEAQEHLDIARAICASAEGSTAGLIDEIDSIERTLEDGIFRPGISSQEMRDVIAAMVREFSGTGHWYLCENGHPFTVGECGRPMETSRCPQCGAPVGGRNHEAASGVRRVEDFEQQFGGISLDR